MATFNKAFAAARKAGKKEFTWNGKKYTTKLKEEAKKDTRPKAKPKAIAQGKQGPAKATPKDAKAKSMQQSSVERGKRMNVSGPGKPRASAKKPAARRGGR